MIRSVKDLQAAIDRGETVCVQPVDASPGKFRTCLTSTGETVFKRPISTMVEHGTLQVIARDICGEPMQWARA